MQNSKKIFNVRVVPRARVNSITTDENGTLRVHTTTVPENGKANDAVVRALAKYFDIPRSSIHIIRGQTSHNKVVEIL